MFPNQQSSEVGERRNSSIHSFLHHAGYQVEWHHLLLLKGWKRSCSIAVRESLVKMILFKVHKPRFKIVLTIDDGNMSFSADYCNRMALM
jgi:hypothetical protein